MGTGQREEVNEVSALVNYLDTNGIIYLVEQNAVWLPKVVARLTEIHRVGEEVAVGDLSRMECLVAPLRDGDQGVQSRYKSFFSDPAIRVLTLPTPVFELAATIRADTRIKIPDALHLATAIHHGCGRFITADAKLARCEQIAVEVLS